MSDKAREALLTDRLPELAYGYQPTAPMADGTIAIMYDHSQFQDHGFPDVFSVGLRGLNTAVLRPACICLYLPATYSVPIVCLTMARIWPGCTL